jgi:hypothetical protein
MIATLLSGSVAKPCLNKLYKFAKKNQVSVTEIQHSLGAEKLDIAVKYLVLADDVIEGEAEILVKRTKTTDGNDMQIIVPSECQFQSKTH